MPSNKRRSRAGMAMGVLVVALIAALSFWALGRNKTTESTLIKGKVERGSIRISVNATGTLEAVRTVQVGSQISGQIAKLHADYNSAVKQGQLLAEIDPRTFQSQVLTEQAQNAAAQSRLQSTQADLANQEANLVQVQANLKVAQVANENALLLYARSKQLLAKGLVSASDDDIARTNAESAAAKVEQAQAAVKQAQAQIRSRQSAIEQSQSDIVGAKAQLERAQINLELTKIYSPVDGVVISRNVDIGQTVAASLSAPVLFLIANDLSRMQVKANIDEADIGKITNEVQVAFTVDAYPNDSFSGTISEVRLEPQTVQNVVTYSVIIGSKIRS
jgi:HlyD family secretion protein